ncbi:MAG: hypothetical protein QM680_07340 [Luteolibacter sp.]
MSRNPQNLPFPAPVAPSGHAPLKIVEINDEEWAAFKRMEAAQRLEYALSEEAIRDHEAWVNAPMASDDEWGSIPEEEEAELREPVIIPNPDQIPYDELVDFSELVSK